jgi:hypothetical protein
VCSRRAKWGVGNNFAYWVFFVAMRNPQFVFFVPWGVGGKILATELSDHRDNIAGWLRHTVIVGTAIVVIVVEVVIMKVAIGIAVVAVYNATGQADAA